MPVRLQFGQRSANIDGRNTIVQGKVVDHMQRQAVHQRKKAQTPGTEPSKFAVYANQSSNLRGAGAEAVLGSGTGYGSSSPRRYRDVCQHDTGLRQERVINKHDNRSPIRQNRPYGASPAAAAIRPPTGTGGFAASVPTSLGSPDKSLPKACNQPSPHALFKNGKRVATPAAPRAPTIAASPAKPAVKPAVKRMPTPMPGTVAAAQASQEQCANDPHRVQTAGFKNNQRGFNTAHQYHQSVHAPAFSAKNRNAVAPPAAMGQLADFGGNQTQGRSHMGKKCNINGNHPLKNSSRHRNTMGGVMPEGGAGYLHCGNRRRMVQQNWNASTESVPHDAGMHAKSNHPLSPRRLIAISQRAAQDIEMRKGAMKGIMQHNHITQ